MAAANPITVRLERLYAQWLDFVDDPPARVLRWLIRDDEYRMIETFVALESSEGGRTMDLFVRVTAPFERMASHALELRNELLQTCRDSQDERVTSWAPPPCTRGVHDELVAACDSLIAHIRGHGLAIDHLVIVLLPATIFAQPAWQQWVRDLAVALSGEGATPSDLELDKEAARLRKRFERVKDQLRELARADGLL